MATFYSNAKRIFPIIMVSNIQFMLEICTFGDCIGSLRASNYTHMLYYDTPLSITIPLINAVKNDVSTLKGEFIEDGLKLKLYSSDIELNLETSYISDYTFKYALKAHIARIKQKEMNNELTNKITELSDKIDALVKKVSEPSWWTWW
jgi:hypothetical protein